MGTVAKGFVTGVLTVTQSRSFRFGEGKLFGPQSGALVGSVAKRLSCAATAGAPPVVASSEGQNGGFTVMNDFFGHASLYPCSAHCHCFFHHGRGGSTAGREAVPPPPNPCACRRRRCRNNPVWIVVTTDGAQEPIEGETTLLRLALLNLLENACDFTLPGGTVPSPALLFAETQEDGGFLTRRSRNQLRQTPWNAPTCRTIQVTYSRE